MNKIDKISLALEGAVAELKAAESNWDAAIVAWKTIDDLVGVERALDAVEAAEDKVKALTQALESLNIQHEFSC